MHEALHPYTEKPITAEAYFLEFGRPVATSSAVDTRPRARCPFCPQQMSVVGAAKGGHFAHLPKSDWCPSKEKTAEPYDDGKEPMPVYSCKLLPAIKMLHSGYA